MILADTSIWVDHLRKEDPLLYRLLMEGKVVTHPFIIGEIALGSLRNRSAVLTLLSGLPQTDLARYEEVLPFIGRHHLFARGIGYVDAHLLVSLRLTPAVRFWTRDKRLLQVAESLSLAVGPDAP